MRKQIKPIEQIRMSRSKKGMEQAIWLVVVAVAAIALLLFSLFFQDKVFANIRGTTDNMMGCQAQSGECRASCDDEHPKMISKFDCKDSTPFCCSLSKYNIINVEYMVQGQTAFKALPQGKTTAIDPKKDIYLTFDVTGRSEEQPATYCRFAITGKSGMPSLREFKADDKCFKVDFDAAKFTYEPGICPEDAGEFTFIMAGTESDSSCGFPKEEYPLTVSVEIYNRKPVFDPTTHITSTPFRKLFVSQISRG